MKLREFDKRILLVRVCLWRWNFKWTPHPTWNLFSRYFVMIRFGKWSLQIEYLPEMKRRHYTAVEAWNEKCRME